MAPNKKKKKPASNPARGFATTSTASKAKTRDLESEVADGNTPVAEETNTAPNPLSILGGAPDLHEDKSLSELTAEELERHLEESELQAMIDKHGDAVHRLTSRTVSKLETEKRLLRPQGDPLTMDLWLPAQVVEDIVNEESVLDCDRVLVTDGVFASKSRIQTPQDDLLLKMWALHEILPQLGFSAEQRWSALKDVLVQDQSMAMNTYNTSRDNVWGLDQSLDWLARRADRKYNLKDIVTRTEPAPRLVLQDMRDLDGTAENLRSVSPAPNDVRPYEAHRDLNHGNGTSETFETSSESELGSDLETEKMIESYVALQTRRFRLDPESAYSAKGRLTNQAVKQTRPNYVSRKLARIDTKLTKIRNDILFEQKEAEAQWNLARIELVREIAERRRLGVNGFQRSLEIEDRPKPSGMSSSDSVSVTQNETEEIFGGLFSDAPEAEKAEPSEGDQLDKTIQIKDFGAWSGIYPRRLLEDTIHARDSGAQVSFNVLSESRLYVQHALHIRHTRPQDEVDAAFLPSISFEMFERESIIKMTTIACPNRAQSEAYVSTLGLFLYCCSSPKEEKSFLRLPAIWRELWQELVALRKQHNDAVSRETLKSLRNLIEERNTHVQEGKNLIDGPKASSKSRQGLSVTESAGQSNHTGNDQVIEGLWRSRVNTPAYKSMLRNRQELPIWAYKDQLLRGFSEHQVVIVCGETGCGKSTQVPAFILEEELSHARQCKVICTEPRRISAISLARRVSEELGERKSDLGTHRSLVGYAIRLENKTNPQNRIIYATTGVVMRMLESAKDLEEYTHLVLDEVHERSIESDFLLIVLKKLLLRRPTLRVILMSATVNAEKFSQYLDNAPILNVPGRTFSVATQYLEDAIEATGFSLGRSTASTQYLSDEVEEDDAAGTGDSTLIATQEYSQNTRSVLEKFNEYQINFDLAIRLLEHIATNSERSRFSKAILVFLPGIAEIKRLKNLLMNTSTFSHQWKIYALHSAIATEEQEDAFLIPPPGTRKIVLATNIAETGITIPDVTCVIDTGKHKEMRFDEKRQLSRLIESFISRANAKQRRGRAGRVQEGLCFHLFTKHRHDHIMSDDQTSEMLRLSLQDLILRVKICKLGAVEETLSEALDPPSSKNIRRAMEALMDVKALSGGEELTPLGIQLAKLPLDVFLGKLVILGAIFSCLDVSITIAAILSSKSPFTAPLGNRAQADSARLAFRTGDSDLLTVYNAYSAWKRVCTTNGVSEQHFCRVNCLSPQTLSNIEDLKAQLLSSLSESGFVTLSRDEHVALQRLRNNYRHRDFVQIPQQYNNNGQSDLIVNSVIAWSFYPKLLRRDGKGWRNIANNQSVSLHTTSIHKGKDHPPKWISFYHIMQSSNKFYNAHENSAVEDFPIALLCGDVEFKMYSGTAVIDGNRIRFTVDGWKTLLAVKTLRARLQQILQGAFRKPSRQLSAQEQRWMNIWQRVFTREEKKTATVVHR